MKIFAKYFKGLAAPSIIAPLFKMLEAFFELLVPLVVADIIDNGISSGSMRYVAARVGVMFLLAAIGWVCAVTAQYFAAKSALGMARALRSDLLRHIQTFSFTEFDRIGTPTLVTRMTTDVTLMQNAVNLVLRVMLRCPFIIVGAIVMACSVSPGITLVFLAVTALITLALVLVLRGSMSQFVRAQTMLDRVTLKVRENIAGARVVRAFGGQDQEREEFDGANDALRRFQTAAGRISAALNPLTFLLINLGIIVVLTAGGRQVYAGILTQGQITALVNYMTQILLSFIRISELVIAISRGLAGARRIKGVLETDTSMPDPAVLGSAGGQTGTGFAAAPVDASAEPAAEVSAVPAADVNAAAPAVELDHVSFTYSGASEPALKDIDLAAAPGETIGIIGGTGAGNYVLAESGQQTSTTAAIARKSVTITGLCCWWMRPTEPTLGSAGMPPFRRPRCVSVRILWLRACTRRCPP